MKMRDFLGIPKRKGKIANHIKSKLRHNHAILVNAGKPRYLVARSLSSQWDISLSSFYKIIE